MRIQKVKSLVVAENILNVLQNCEKAFSKLKDVSILVESYQNGREQGHIYWGISYMDKDGKIQYRNDLAYYVCQGRRTDNITIYKGAYAMQSISEDAYKNSAYFKEDAYTEAVDWLISDILKETLRHENN